MSVVVEEYPVVTIVTASYNMAPYLEEAIGSVLSQDYRKIDYLVLDGGSTDGTLDILRKYHGRLRYQSRPDDGQADAINQGVLLSQGSVVGFLNADDTYLPYSVGAAVRHLVANRGFAGVYGEAYLVAEDGSCLGCYPTKDFDADLLQYECFICQPASFLWRNDFAEAGMMNPRFDFAPDYELWMRIAKRHSLLRVNDVLARSRMHPGAKTFRHRSRAYRDGIVAVKTHYSYVPFRHVYGYCCSLLDRHDGFFEPVKASVPKYALSLLYGSYQNWRHILRFGKESLSEGLSAIRRGVWP